MEGRIFFDSEQFACSELLLQALDGFDGVLVGGPDIENGVFDPIPTAVRPSLAPLGKVSVIVPYTEKIDTVINDVILSIYIPHQSIAELTIGIPSIEDKSILLAAQEADVRADNGKILGAFVYKGEHKAWGLSKRGYCAIINGIVTVGVSDNSPLFEEATERGGYYIANIHLLIMETS